MPQVIEFRTERYTWRWSPETDTVTLADSAGRPIFTHPLQPEIEIDRRDALAPGAIAEFSREAASLRVRYAGVHGAGETSVALRFLDTHYVLDRTSYAPHGEVAVVRVSYFGRCEHGAVVPAGIADTCVVPGGRQDPETAIFRTAGLEDVRFNVGCFSKGATYHQQWALPHYLVCCYNDAGADALPPTACIGLGGVPAGAAQVFVDRGRLSYELVLRDDAWPGARSTAARAFDTPLVVAIGDDWYDAGRRYFAALASEGFTPPREMSALPPAAFLPQYDTWGDQGARRSFLERFDETGLRAIYADFRASGLRSKLFVIDDKWEGLYGSLEHDRKRFPQFDALLDEIRSDGHEIGLWTAFPRCEDYRAFGLSEDDVLVRPDGTPYVEVQRKRSWCVFDPTSPAAAAHLAQRARAFVRRYRPALVKIDFGYEIPPPDAAGPHDPSRRGERLFQRFIEIVVGALKDADPNVAVLYYCLTPLYGRNIDLCGADDLWMSRGDYASGFARRALLSTWCGGFGMVPYGSSGYDWSSVDEIWLDTAALGTPGVIAPLAGDEHGAHLTPEQAARYNGVARLARRSTRYSVEFYDADLRDPASGPVARSWARIEGGEPAVVVARPRADGPATTPLVVSDIPAVVASLDERGILRSPRIGVVPFADGRITIRRPATPATRADAHLFDGRQEAAHWTADAGSITIEVTTRAADAMPVEWIEVRF